MLAVGRHTFIKLTAFWPVRRALCDASGKKKTSRKDPQKPLKTAVVWPA